MLYLMDPRQFFVPVGPLFRDRRWNGGILINSLAKKMHRFLVSEDGPTAVEYAVMLALIVLVCLTAITAVGTKTSTTFGNMATSL